MDQIVVGVDVSTESEGAVRWATAVASAGGATLAAVHAVPEGLHELPIDQERMVRDGIGAELESWIAPAVAAGVEVDVVVTEGDPREALMGRADDTGADLIVVGRASESAGPGFLHLRSVAEYLAHHATHPLAVVTGGGVPVARIALGVDGSPESLAAARWCAGFAVPLAASVVGVSVVEPVVEWTYDLSPRNWRRRVEAEIEEWAAPVIDTGVSFTAVAERALSPAEGLLGVVEREEIDLLVVGTKKVGGRSKRRVGGVALKILHGAGCSVLFVPPE